MDSPFDKIAQSYDSLFTETVIGKLQRNIVWNYLDENFYADDHLKVLELNCGTGEDAVFFARKGFRVTATDVSDGMLKVTEDKIKRFGFHSQVEVKKADINNPADLNFDKNFDLVFSNFGGLNCIGKNSLEELSKTLKNKLNKHGRIIFVIMPKLCLWESFYFLTKLKPASVFRRRASKPINVQLNGSSVATYYHSPSNIKKMFAKNFKLINVKPVGIFIPPSFLNDYFSKRNKTLTLLNKMENKAGRTTFLSNFSDHFLIDMELKD